MGIKASKDICKHFNNDLNCIIKASESDFTKIDGIGDVTTEYILKLLRNENNIVLINKLLEYVEFEKENDKIEDNKLKGKIFVITEDVHVFKNRRIRRKSNGKCY